MPALIVAAYNPFTDDRAPVELALEAGERNGAAVIAAAVQPFEAAEGLDEPQADASVVTQALDTLREELSVETKLLTDVSAPHALHEFARNEDATMIVVGSTTRDRIGRALTGSTAERLLQGAPCAIALAPYRHARRELRTIAVGFANTAEGLAALTTAHALASRFGSRLRVIAALEAAGGFDAAKFPGLKPQRGVMLEGRGRQEVQAALERAIEALPAGVTVEHELHVDDPAEVLLRISENVDLLVVGSRGYGPLRSVLLGGVSRRLVDGAGCPVLLLPRGVERPLESLLEGRAATG